MTPIGQPIPPADCCPDCAVRPGQPHRPGCDVERCPRCGRQAIGCDCQPATVADLPPVLWAGEWPGVAECRAFGWYCVFVPDTGFLPCAADAEHACPDLSRLYRDCVWSRELGRYVKPQPQEKTP